MPKIRRLLAHAPLASVLSVAYGSREGHPAGVDHNIPEPLRLLAATSVKHILSEALRKKV